MKVLLLSLVWVAQSALANQVMTVEAQSLDTAGRWIDSGMRLLGYQNSQVLNCGGGGASALVGVVGSVCQDYETSQNYYMALGSVGVDLRGGFSGLHVRCYYNGFFDLKQFFKGGRGGIAIPLVSLGADVAVLWGEQSGVCISGSGGFGRALPVSGAALYMTFADTIEEAKAKIQAKVEEFTGQGSDNPNPRFDEEGDEDGPSFEDEGDYGFEDEEYP